MPTCRILHARYVFPIVGEPIENGFVRVEDGRIAEVGKIPPPGEWLDLGNVALLPGLINAHTHLEFSGLSRPLGTPGMGFVDWIREVIARRRERLMETETALAEGMRQCAQQGVTTVGNIAQWEECEISYENSFADGYRFVECIAPHRSSVPNVADTLLRDFPRRQKEKNAAKWRFGLSPHAPYSVHPDLLKLFATFSVVRKAPLAMHLAESRAEMQLLAEGDGPFRDFLQEREIFDPAVFPGGKRPLDYLHLFAEAPRLLVIHGNYLDDEEIAFLGKMSPRISVVYCPRTHEFFRHDPYPLEKMLAAGVLVALGTDSRASSPDLSLHAEMRFVAQRYPQISRAKILAIGTLDAARALGRADEIGSLEPGKAANFAVVALPEGDDADPYRLILESAAPVVQTWFRGRPVSAIAPP
jgi:aminodeoxyfutalosine deaminase